MVLVYLDLSKEQLRVIHLCRMILLNTSSKLNKGIINKVSVMIRKKWRNQPLWLMKASWQGYLIN